MTIEDSARQREESDLVLRGVTPEARQISARIVVKLARRKGQEPEQWIVDVAEGRLPA